MSVVVPHDDDPSARSAGAKHLTTKSLVLRRFTADDRVPFARLNADPAVMEYFPARLTEVEALAFQERIDAHFEEHGFGFWVVSPRDSSELLGLVGLNVPTFEAHFTPCVEIGWRFWPAYWGKGLATEAATACLAFAFQELDLAQVVAFTTVTNARSERVMQRLGMKPCGEFLHPALAGHRYARHLLYRIERARRAVSDELT
jgi:RimJ/RimL family protein N-acetyltransferase